jgi:hypothetical protein
MTTDFLKEAEVWLTQVLSELVVMDGLGDTTLGGSGFWTLVGEGYTSANDRESGAFSGKHLKPKQIFSYSTIRNFDCRAVPERHGKVIFVSTRTPPKA